MRERSRKRHDPRVHASNVALVQRTINMAQAGLLAEDIHDAETPIGPSEIVPFLRTRENAVVICPPGENGLPNNMALLEVNNISGPVKVVIAQSPDDAVIYFRSPQYDCMRDIVLAPGKRKSVHYEFNRQRAKILSLLEDHT